MGAITGTDEVSLKVLTAIQSGVKVIDIPQKYGISLDQAKRLSRLSNLLESTYGHISPEAYEQLKQLGSKAIVLSPLLKNLDWDGINDILLSVPLNITRDQLKDQLVALQKKRERILSFQEEVDWRLYEINQKNKELIKSLDELNNIQIEMDKQVTFLSKYEPAVKQFLFEHLGVTKGGHLCLAKRLDYQWQKKLQKKGFLKFLEPPHASSMHYDNWMEEYGSSAYTYLIKDLNSIAAELPLRWKRGWDCEWNYEKEEKRSKKHNNKFFGWAVPSNPNYKNVEPMSAELNNRIAEVKKQLIELEEESDSLQREILNLKKTSPQSFIEQVEARDKLSQNELKKHGQLQELALKWLFGKGYVCLTEFTLPNGKRIDTIGFNEDGHIIAIEVKSSQKDYLSDQKWGNYLDYCDEFYFLLERSFWSKHSGPGLLEVKGKRLNIAKECEIECSCRDREKLIFNISRSLSKKLTFGY